MIKIKNAKALYAEEDKLWISRGLSFWAVDYAGKPLTTRIKVGSSLFNIRPLRQLLRKGIHHFIPLKNGNYFLTLKKKSIVIDKNGTVINEFSGYSGNKPGHRGVCMTPNGYVFFGEYALNSDRTMEIKLYRSTDNCASFQPIKVFKPGEIRHIHFIEWDKYSNCIWLGTGDYGDDDSECCLFRSFDYGETFELVGTGSQNWRSIALCPCEGEVIWGTDAGHCKDDNHVFKYDKNTNELKEISFLPGPCHGICVTKNSEIYVSTGVEGGENEKDKFARLYKVKEEQIEELLKIKKDIYPLIFQYGVIRFPSGCENTDRVIYTMMGLKHNGETIYIGE